MIELLRGSAGREPSATAVISNDGQVTYEALLANAEATAGWLAERGIGRFAIVDQDAGTVIALLAGASLAGSEACVYPPIDQGSPGDLSSRFDHALIVSDAEDLETVGEVVSPAAIFAASAAQTAEEPPAERPLLVLTTGTTGEPRGACHDWSRVLRRALESPSATDERWLLAYGLQQFGGLQVLIHVMAVGATLVAPTPRRPQQGLAAMRAHAVTYASATPTFWRFVLAEMRADGEPVPALRQITLGGEAVPGQLISDIRAAFPETRVSQIYGANEFGTGISVRDRLNGLPASALADEDVDVAFKVVDGELWVRSRIGMLGYYGEDPIDQDAWRATGDLVEVEGDRIHFRGRTGDTINVGGVKVHPLPIEERVSKVPEVVLARVYGRANALSGEIVAVEAVAAPGADPDDVKQAIRTACADLQPAAQPRSVKLVEEIDTLGQKISRRAGN